MKSVEKNIINKFETGIEYDEIIKHQLEDVITEQFDKNNNKNDLIVLYSASSDVFKERLGLWK